MVKEMKATLKVIVDIFMTVSLLLLMAYSLIGTDWHEYIGIFMFVLFVVHHFLNRSWSRNVLRGRYSAFRIVEMVLVVLILLCMISSMVSGIILSRHVFTALPIHAGKALSGTVHMLAGYWGFLFMSIHLGLHWNQIKIMAEKFIPIKNRVKTVIGYLPVLISVYGVFAFFKRGIPGYLTLRMHFVFFDFDEPMAFFFADYIAVMILFVWAGYLIGSSSKEKKN
jgi:hypothetical protein